jgi:hypothetical protein
VIRSARRERCFRRVRPNLDPCEVQVCGLFAD